MPLFTFTAKSLVAFGLGWFQDIGGLTGWRRHCIHSGRRLPVNPGLEKRKTREQFKFTESVPCLAENGWVLTLQTKYSRFSFDLRRTENDHCPHIRF